MTEIMICMIIMFTVAIASIVILSVLHSKSCACYEKMIKQYKKQVAVRDKEIEMQEFVIQTQSKLIEKMRS